MAGVHWLISGVGRSGTTMAYSALLSAARSHDPETLGRYEPLLWGEATWDKYPTQIGSAFSRTDALSAPGLFAHTQSPLLLEVSNKVFDKFIADIFPPKMSVVAKVIRGAGRLNAFLQRNPNLKIIHLVRNPLDVVNSSLHYFSFFGSEFHTSDEPRFNIEAAKQFPEKFRSTEGLTEAQKAFEWWRIMNEAALASAKQYSRRVKVVAYEHLMADVSAGLTEMVKFLGGSEEDLASWSPDENVGPVTRTLALSCEDRDALMPHLDDYLSDARIFNSRKNRIDREATKAELVEKYSSCSKGPAYSSPIDPTLSPPKVRALAKQARAEAEAARTAGATQADTIAASVAERNKADLESLKGKLGELIEAELSKLGSQNGEQTDKLQAVFDAMAAMRVQTDTIAASVAERNRKDLETLKGKLGELIEAESLKLGSQAWEQSQKLQTVLDAMNASHNENAARFIDEIQEHSDALASIKQDVSDKSTQVRQELSTLLARTESQLDERLGERIAVVRAIVESGFAAQNNLTSHQIEVVQTALRAHFSEQSESASVQFEEIKSCLESRIGDREALIVELGKRGEEVAALRNELRRKEALIHELEGALAEARTETDQMRADSAQDMRTLRELADRLKYRVTALQDEQKTHEDTLAKMRMEKRQVGDKLRQTEQKLKAAAGERERYRKQLVETSAALTPRLMTVLSLRPLRYILNQRRWVKAGVVQIDADGIAQPRNKS